MTDRALKYLVVFMSLLIVALGVVFIALLLYKPAALKVTQLPAFGMEGLNSAELMPYKDQDIYAVNLFASWCKPCRAEMPHLAELSKHIAVYGIAVRDERGDTEAFLADMHNPYTRIGHDYAGMMVKALGADGVPETLILHKNGEILHRYRGAFNRSAVERYRKLITDISD